MEREFKYTLILSAIIISISLIFEFSKLPFLLKSVITTFAFLFSLYLFNPFLIPHVFELKENEDKRLEEIVEKTVNLLKLKIRPKIFIMDVNYQNAMAFGNIFFKSIMFTKGILDVLNDEELMAITAHELAHLKNHDPEKTLSIVLLLNTLIIFLINYSYVFLLLQLLLSVPLFTFIMRLNEKKADITAVKDNRWLTVHFENALIKTEYILQGHNSDYLKDVTDFKNIPLHVLHLAKQDLLNTKEGKSWFSSFLDTHPSLQERLKYLSKYEY